MAPRSSPAATLPGLPRCALPSAPRAQAQALLRGLGDAAPPSTRDAAVLVVTRGRDAASWAAAQPLPVVLANDAKLATLSASERSRSREAVGVLSYIVDHYHELPSAMVFAHDGYRAWLARGVSGGTWRILVQQ